MRVFLADGYHSSYMDVPFENGYSFRAGKPTDGARHFNDPVGDDIPEVGDGNVVVTGIDPATLYALMRMAGKEPFSPDLIPREEMHLSSLALHRSELGSAQYFRVGIQVMMRWYALPPRCGQPTDITDIVERMMRVRLEKVIGCGREEVAKTDYSECFKDRSGIVGLWVIGSGQPSSPARTYQDGMTISVAYHSGKKKITISSHPKTDQDFEEREIAGIKFTGSIHSSGSLQGMELTVEDAWKVFREIAGEIARDEKRYVIEPLARGRSVGED